MVWIWKLNQPQHSLKTKPNPELNQGIRMAKDRERDGGMTSWPVEQVGHTKHLPMKLPSPVSTVHGAPTFFNSEG